VGVVEKGSTVGYKASSIDTPTFIGALGNNEVDWKNPKERKGASTEKPNTSVWDDLGGERPKCLWGRKGLKEKVRGKKPKGAENERKSKPLNSRLKSTRIERGNLEDRKKKVGQKNGGRYRTLGKKGRNNRLSRLTQGLATKIQKERDGLPGGKEPPFVHANKTKRALVGRRGGGDRLREELKNWPGGEKEICRSGKTKTTHPSNKRGY